ncbi:MAG: hypothetical protein K9G39_08990 [Chlorobium sp.]|uniref:hypothetical protein n=1 Tax=Chlorobium sp. TaxID=1095 RepID=UPI0025BB9124|nr:hypothetical protein [Chlorobium sp.]MCF8383708.1 hypothetical protein [Chlorobium sp.]
MNMKSPRLTLFLFSVLLLAGNSIPAPVSGSQKTGTTTLSIKLPDCIILHYYSALNLTFEEYSRAIEEGGGGTWNVQWNGAAAGGNQLSASSIQDVLPGTVALTIPNVWAIRGLSPSGNAKVTITVVNNQLVSGSSKITILSGSDQTLIDDNAGHSGTSINTSLNGIAASNATIGNVRMTLDFSKTNMAGAHSGGQYKITAETI